jgi:ribosomal protein S12 methylthiotransferase accessory factor
VTTDLAFERTLHLANQLISPVTGVLKRSLLLPLVGGQAPYAHFAAAPASYGTLPTGGDIANPGASAWDLRQCLSQVTFEAVERYCAAFVYYSALLLSKPEGPAFDVGCAIQRFAEFQYGRSDFSYVPLRQDSVIHWAVGRSLFTGQRRYIPASFTYLPYRPTSPDEVIGPSFSTGMSAAWTLDDACLSGLLEVVERDAFAITWMGQLVRPRLEPRPDSELARRVAAVEADGCSSVTFVDLTTDLGLPVVCAVVRRPALGRVLTTVGLSSKLCPSRACDKALCEALSDHERLRTELADPRRPPWTPAPDFSDVVDFEWHGRAYTDPRAQLALDFLTSSSEVHQIDGEFAPPQAGDLVRTLRQLEEHCSDVVMVDLTTRDMHELGLVVVKIFVPELVPLNADHRYPYLGHRRLHTHGGQRPDGTQEQLLTHLNSYPHPFS